VAEYAEKVGTSASHIKDHARPFSASLPRAAQGQASIQSISNWNSPSMPSARITPT